MDRTMKQRSDAGFTLLELMIVLAIITIGVTVAITSYVAQIESTRVKGDVRDFEQAVQLAKMNAITKNIPHGIYIDRGRSCYFIFRDNAIPPDGDGAFTGALNYDPDTGFLVGHDDEESATADFVLRREPTYLSRRNRFTCVFGSESGNSVIMFDGMGRVTPNVARNVSIVGIQRSPDVPGSTTETKNRGFVHIDMNTGIPSTTLVQPAPTGNWCQTDITP